MSKTVSRTFFLVGLPAALGLVALIWGGLELRRFLLSSPRFAVRSVEVMTTGKVDADAILKRAAVPRNANVFSLDLEEIRQRVEEEPWVYSATVVRALPNRIQIHYVSQVPKAILGAASMYYLNSDGRPFYRIKEGDPLNLPLVQVEGKIRDAELLRQRMEASLQILESLKASALYSEKDLGDMTVRLEGVEGTAPYLLTMRFPPQPLLKKKGLPQRPYLASFGPEEALPQVRRWEAVVRYLAQQSRNPRLIRLELGKKVVVKVER